MSSPATTANNYSTGSQQVANGSGHIFTTSGGVQLNICSPTGDTVHLVTLLQEVVNSQRRDGEPDYVRFTQKLPQPSVDPSYRHVDLLRQATPGTGKWVLSKEEFCNWKESSGICRLLFVHGNIGSGKSILSAIIIDSLQKQYHDNRDIICVYLFFDEGDTEMPLADAIWAGLLLQLLRDTGRKGIAKALKSEVDNRLGEPCALHPSKCLELFKAQAETFDTVYLIIDGLDNSGNEKQQQDILTAVKGLPSNVKTLITSSTELGIQDTEVKQTLCLKPHEADVTAFVEAQIKNHTSFHLLLQEYKMVDRVTKSVVNQTMDSGIFLLAKLYLDALHECNTPKKVEDELSQLPNNLSKMFKGAIKRIAAKGRYDNDLAKHVLTWLVHAKVDLTIDQIRDSCAFLEGNGDSWQRSRPSRDSLVRVCAGLVVEDHDKGTLRLVHESVKHHLEGSNVLYENADLEIAKVCLSCLLADDSSAKAETPLLEYASHYWTHHCHDGQHRNPQVEADVKKFLCSERKLVRAFKLIPGVPSCKLNNITGLHAAVFYDLGDWVTTLIKDGIGVNAQCSDGQTPLHWAVTLGRHQLVGHLLQNLADPNIADNSRDTPIHKCLAEPTVGSLEIVQALLDGGAEINKKGAKSLTPLSLVIKYGPTSIAKLLIRKMADVNAEEVITPGWTPLRELLNHGHEMASKFEERSEPTGHSSTKGWSPLKRAIDDHVHQLMQLLLQRGADPNRPTKDDWLPLIYAVKMGRTKTVQRLLDSKTKPVDVNLRDPVTKMSPLCLALTYERNDIVRQLVEAGSDVNKKNARGQTPLIQAVQGNDQDLVWLLLEKGAQPSALDDKGWSALHYAIEAKKKDVIWLLVTKGANLQLYADGAPSFLSLALSIDDVSVAWLLNEHGADIHATDGAGRTTLHQACIEDNLRFVRLLLDMGSMINSQDLTYSTPLHHSVRWERVKVIDLLASKALESGGLDEQNEEGNTALMLATIMKNRTMIESLLRYGASYTMQNKEGLTALHIAANLGFNDGLRLLVKADNVNMANEKGYTPLHCAVVSKEANADTLDILYAGGANLDMEQEWGYSPCTLASLMGKNEFARQLAAYKPTG